MVFSVRRRRNAHSEAYFLPFSVAFLLFTFVVFGVGSESAFAQRIGKVQKKSPVKKGVEALPRIMPDGDPTPGNPTPPPPFTPGGGGGGVPDLPPPPPLPPAPPLPTPPSTDPSGGGSGGTPAPPVVNPPLPPPTPPPIETDPPVIVEGNCHCNWDQTILDNASNGASIPGCGPVHQYITYQSFFRCSRLQSGTCCANAIDRWSCSLTITITDKTCPNAPDIDVFTLPECQPCFTNRTF